MSQTIELHYNGRITLISITSSAAGDCHNSKGEAGMCVAGAINNYTNQLYSYGNPSKLCKIANPNDFT